MSNRRRGPQSVPEKPKDFKKTWGKLIINIKEFVPAIIVALVSAVIGTIFTLMGPNKIKDMTNIIQEGIVNEFKTAGGEVGLPGIDVSAITRIAVTLAILYGIGVVLNYIQGYIMTTVTQKITYKLRRDLSAKINNLPLRYFDKSSTGDILSRVTNDIDTIGMTLNQSIGSLITGITLFVGSFIMMISINIPMAIAGVLSTLIGFALMTVFIVKTQKFYMRQQSALGKINGHIEENFTGHVVLTAYNGEKAAKETFDEHNDDLYKNGWKAQFAGAIMQPLMGFIGNIGYVVICIVGAYLFIEGKIDFGVITAFMIYIRLFTQPLSQFAQAASSLQSTAAASERVFEILEEKEMNNEDDKTDVITNANGDVEFSHVKFGYDEDKIIIKDFSAKVKAGQKIAIVGPTGAGKTTLVNLLMKFYKITDGDIKVDGISINNLTRENIHALFGMVLQDTWMFEGTIRENIVYSKEGATDEDVMKACKAVGLDKFIRMLPKGLDTIMDDKALLSSGQKQLITIARAMVENAPLLILDEATSSVDTRTELLIQSAMDTLMKGRTSFVIAHRLSTIKNADIILVMKDGDIIEQGSHDKLMADDGFYASMYNSQFESFA